MPTPIISLDHVGKTFHPPFSFSRYLSTGAAHAPAVSALKELTWDIQRGSTIAVLGPNGAGKTTLLKILATLILPDEGTARVNGFDVSKHDRKIKGSIGFCSSDERSFYWRLTGRQNLNFFASLYGLSSSESDRRIKKLCGLFSVTFADNRFDSYSSGMKQIFSLIRALLHDPAILLLDEPYKALDYTTAQTVRAVLKSICFENAPKTVLFTTHHMDEAEHGADAIAIMHKGTLRACGTMPELRARYKKPDARLGDIFRAAELGISA